MNTNKSSPNNFSNNVHESNLQTTTSTQQAYDTYDTYTHVTYSNDVNNAIFDQQSQQSMSNNNANIASPNHNHQQQYQYIHQSDIPNNTVTITPDNNYQQSMSNNNVNISTDNNHHVSNNIPHNNIQQQSTFNNVSPPQQNQPSDSSQSNILPLLNSFGINISSPQATIIIMPTTNSDIQNQLQQVLAYLNRSQQ
ncbi:uncharacterized protein OCT59_014840 [Rhizophagus irregularis]|uniref:Uncharacterized protein n=2 Tax=Rhizophagus irregularis TaxID=588596 RepID=A0A015J1E0_RHIIW|nr:hypothetical protein RirG_179110 [Rhizophagus irregularis DAOM 197198w]UZO22478.1 hypothetical protein OCT59_014840 [Rhizophagus irregularis]GBC43937.1 hypothetical protein GLOIN_2v1880782 [Rhizophagus irregularis DAOM 181602=DAOM 197198]CAG8645929.1 7751_t:CDS:1 [Rhizophagus irregularis]